MTERSPLWPYAERNGSVAHSAVEALMADPEYVWDEAEAAELRSFADGLIHAERTDSHIPSLESVNKPLLEGAPKAYYLDYFKTEQGKDALESLGMDREAEEDAIKDALYSAVATGNAPDPKTRSAIATASLNWYKGELQGRLLQDASHDAAQPDPPILQISFAPDKLLKKFADLQAYRSFYRDIQQDIHSGADSNRTTIAKQVLLDVHRGCINSMVATLYPNMLRLARQLKAAPKTPDVIRWQEQLREVAPVVAHAYDAKNGPSQDFEGGFARRLDLVRNGAYNAGTPDHNYSPVDGAVLALAQEIEAAETAPMRPDVAQLPPEVIEHATTTVWQAPEMVHFLETVLVEWDQLSEIPADWDVISKRDGPAADGKWQVVVTSTVTTLDADTKKMVVKVPKKFKDLLITGGGGALPRAAHELTHTVQHEGDTLLANQVPLAEMQGAHTKTAREEGGVEAEREVLAAFGFSRPNNTTYLRALQAKLAGGNQTQTARTYLMAATQGQEHLGFSAMLEKAKAAAGGALRLFRYEGHDSQTLDYFEQEQLRRAMEALPPEQVETILTSCVSFSLQDTAALHAVGVLKLPTKALRHPAADVIAIYLRDHAPRVSA